MAGNLEGGPSLLAAFVVGWQRRSTPTSSRLGGRQMYGRIFSWVFWLGAALPMAGAIAFQVPENPQADAVVPLVTDVRSLLNVSLTWEEAGQQMVVDRLNIQYYLSGTDVTVFPVWIALPPVELQSPDGTWKAVEPGTELNPHQEKLVLRLQVRNLWADSEGAAPAVEQVMRERLGRRHRIPPEGFRFFEPKIRLPIRAVLKVPLEGQGEVRVSGYVLLTQHHLESVRPVPLRIELDRAALAEAATTLGRPVRVEDLRVQMETEVYCRLETRLIEARLDALQASLTYLREQLKTTPGEPVDWVIAPAGGEGSSLYLLRQVLTESLALQVAVREGADISIGPVAEQLLQHATRQLRRGQVQDAERVALLVSDRLALVGTMGEIARTAKLERKDREEVFRKMEQQVKDGSLQVQAEIGLGLTLLGSPLGFRGGFQGNYRDLAMNADLMEKYHRALDEVGQFYEGKIPMLPALELRAESMDQAFRIIRASMGQSRFTAAFYPIPGPLLELGIVEKMQRVLEEKNLEREGSEKELAFRIRTASLGATLELDAGEYRIDESLVIKKSVALVGKGPGKTILVRDTREPLLRLEGQATLTIRNVTLQQLEETGTPLVLATEGRLIVENVHFQGSGGVAVVKPKVDQSAEKTGGSGSSQDLSPLLRNSAIFLSGSVRAELMNCEIRSFSGPGVYLGESAVATIVDLKVQDCFAGIRAGGNSTGRASKSRCEANLFGAILTNGSTLQLLECLFKDSVHDGIVIAGTSRASVRNCACENNQSAGICVVHEAQPTLEKNIVRQNRGAGIAFAGNAKGIARGNTCEANGGSGIQIQDSAQPALESNTCGGNRLAGIAYIGNSGGSAVGNTCEGNQRDGIYLQDRANPTLQDNICRGNRWSGIAYLGSSPAAIQANSCENNHMQGIFVAGSGEPTVAKNICRGNVYEGILVMDNARPTLEENQCLNNRRNGIAYRSAGAGGIARNNVCNGNGHNGIGIYAGNPQLEGNTCENNVWYAIYRQ